MRALSCGREGAFAAVLGRNCWPVAASGRPGRRARKRRKKRANKRLAMGQISMETAHCLRAGRRNASCWLVLAACWLLAETRAGWLALFALARLQLPSGLIDRLARLARRANGGGPTPEAHRSKGAPLAGREGAPVGPVWRRAGGELVASWRPAGRWLRAGRQTAKPPGRQHKRGRPFVAWASPRASPRRARGRPFVLLSPAAR